MSSLIRMIVLVVLLISTTLISSLIDHSNYENSFKKNINYSDTGYFNNKKVVDSLIRGKELSDLINTNEFKKASSQGFSILAGYIFGGNKTNEKIAMTSPVSMSLEDSMTMMFMVPKKFSKENLPKPNQSEIKFHEEPAKTVAAITFGGWANSKKIEIYKNKLKASLNTLGISYTNHFYFLGYNAPYEVFNRRNEVTVAARAVGSGNTFFLNDIKEAGKKEIGKKKKTMRMIRL